MTREDAELLPARRTNAEEARGRASRTPLKRVLAFTATLVLAMGCGLGELTADYGDPVTLQAPDLVGTWRGGERRIIVFREDRTFTATDLPSEAFHDLLPDTFDPSRDLLDGAGEWTLEPPAKEGLSSDVKLSFRRLGGEDVAMSGPHPSVSKDNGVVRLTFFYVGTGGNSWTAYEKCVADCE
ncbi:hypothetical protein [Micromonospora chersina]|uniref:Uncharacterized protein n=1 Tax=Micromonospora chersina TaxID=47854 RepID=A0A1C6VU07_9ACTN|nr:hypothetical protein [Micromonospora chersina]SCL69838.1 hypothetical protein GA0070603_5284 [Micromonospora chersina]